MPVNVVSQGNPARGCKLEGFTVDPVSVVVEGPEGYLKKLKNINTEPIYIIGRQKSFKKMVQLEPIPLAGRSLPVHFVEVTVNIRPKIQMRTLTEENRM